MSKPESKITKENPLGLVVFSKDKAFWDSVVKNGEIEISRINDALKFQTEVLKMAQEKFNSFRD